MENYLRGSFARPSQDTQLPVLGRFAWLPQCTPNAAPKRGLSAPLKPAASLAESPQVLVQQDSPKSVKSKNTRKQNSPTCAPGPVPQTTPQPREEHSGDRGQAPRVLRTEGTRAHVRRDQRFSTHPSRPLPPCVPAPHGHLLLPRQVLLLVTAGQAHGSPRWNIPALLATKKTSWKAKAAVFGEALLGACVPPLPPSFPFKLPWK